VQALLAEQHVPIVRRDVARAFNPVAINTPDGIKQFADCYGPILPLTGRRIDVWGGFIRHMHRTVEVWKMSIKTGDFSKIARAVQKELPHSHIEGVPLELLLKKDPLSNSARLCIHPRSLWHALWVELLLAIDGNQNLRACVQCRKWFTLEAGQGRSDKEYCSNACRMCAYRKRKGTG
jgi:hypothetical protein